MAIFTLKRLICVLVMVVALTILTQLFYFPETIYQMDKHRELKGIGSKRRFHPPSSSWRKVNNFFVYSSYMLDGNSYEILGVSHGEVSCSNMKCLAYFIHNEEIFYYKGSLSCESRYIKNSFYRHLNMFCKVGAISSDLKPFTSALIDEFNVEYKIPLYVKPMPNEDKGYCACISPYNFGLDLYPAVLFLSYNQLIGFSDIMIYKNEPEDPVLDLIVNGSNSVKTNSSFTSLSTQLWDFPFYDEYASNDLLTKDCLYRSVGKMRVMIVVPWHHYIIPPKIQSTIHLLGELNYSNSIILMKQRKCCLDLSAEEMTNSSVPPIFRQKNCCQTKVMTMLFVNPVCTHQPTKIIKTPAELHTEFTSYCNKICKKTVPNKRKMELYNKAVKNKVFQIWDDLKDLF